ncbi:MAG: S8 family serine peptidase [Candidatus Limnocylindria bacterium]
MTLTALLLSTLLLAPADARAATSSSQPQPATAVIAGQYIVVLRPGSDAVAEAAAAARDHGARITYVYEHALRGFAFAGTAQAAQALSSNPRVEFVSPDRVVQATDQTKPTGIRRMGADQNATAKIDGVDERVSVNVAVIDTGIDIDHPDLFVVGGKNCSTGASYDDGHGHGTHVAGTVAALDNGSGVVGVAPGARLWAVRVLNNSGSGSWSSVICGVDFVTSTRTDTDATNDIAVANMSLGGSGADDGNCGNTNNDALHKAICASVAKGVVYVVAAGNDNEDAAKHVPAAYDEVLTVSALADYDGTHGGLGSPTCANYGNDDELASFSNFGADVDIAAPGVCILSSVKGGGYATYSGTSMASPHVAGAATLYVANNGTATTGAGVAAIRAALTDPSKGYSIAQSDPKGFTGDKDAYPEPLVYVAAAHDVAVTAISAPSWVLQGDSATIDVTVANQGTFSETFDVTLTDTTANVLIGSQSVSLAAGTSTTMSFTWTTSSTTTTGDHTLKAEAASVTGETNTANNTKTATVTVQQASHDVAVTGITAPASVPRGSSATVEVTVANEGTYSETFDVTLTDSTDGVQIGSQSVSLAAGASTKLTFTWTTDITTALGDHTLTATASAVTDETDTADNTKTTTVTVTELTSSIHVGDLDAVSTKLLRGRWSATVTITVHDAAETIVPSATVSGSFTQGTWSKSVSCSTGTGGTCSVASGEFPSNEGKASFTVTGLTHASLAYDGTANHDPDGDSDGTTIALAK